MDNKKIKIAFCTDGIFPYSIGGIQRHSALLIEELSKFNDIHLYVLHPHNEIIYKNKLTIFEIHIENINFKKNYFLECYKYSKRIYTELEKINPDIVYSQGLTVWSGIKDFKENLINNPHGLESFQAIGFKSKLVAIFMKAIQRYIFKNSKYIASEGGHLTKILQKEGFKDKIIFLPNATFINEKKKEIYKENGQKIVVFFIARFVKNKGIHILMQAIEQLNKDGKGDLFHFVLGGKGPLYEYYKTNIKFNNVQLIGFINDENLTKYYLDADVFILPTLFEGMPTVVLEAMSVGLPVIVTDVGATSELINNSTGFLIAKNSAEQVKKALIEYVQLNANEKYQMGKNCRNRIINEFNWHTVAKKHYELFTQIYNKNNVV